MGIGGRSGIRTKGIYDRILSLKREGESNVAFCERCNIGGRTNLSKWKTGGPISGQSLLAISKANKTSLDWIVFGESLATCNSAQLVERIASEINVVLERAYSLTDGQVAGEPLLRARRAVAPSGRKSQG